MSELQLAAWGWTVQLQIRGQLFTESAQAWFKTPDSGRTLEARWEIGS